MEMKQQVFIFWIAWWILACKVQGVNSIAYYNFDIGATTCYECPTGSFAGQMGSTGCEFANKTCLPGTYPTLGADSTSIVCKECPAGTYSTYNDSFVSHKLGNGSCLQCAIGTFSALEGSSSCVSCEAVNGAGANATKPGMTFCDVCGYGKYMNPSMNPSMNSSISCQTCPVGKFCPGGTLFSQQALSLPRAILSSQQTALGLGDFTCRRGYFRSGTLFCCNFNTKYTPGSNGCSHCRPGFTYNALKQECVS